MNDGAERRERLEAAMFNFECWILNDEYRSEAEGWLTARRWLGPVLRLGGSAGVGKVSRKGRGGREEKGEPPIEEDGGRCFCCDVHGAAKMGGLARGEGGEGRKAETGEDQAAVHTGIDRRARSASLSLSVCCRTGLDGSAKRSRQRPVSVSRTRKTRRPSASWIDSMRGANSLFCKAEFMEKV